MLRPCFAGLSAALALTLASSGVANDALKIGDAAPAWKELPGIDGKKHSLADLRDKKWVVLCFTCNSCPVARDYENRIIGFAKKHAGDVAFVAINVNKIPEDGLPKMKERAEKQKFGFPYLFDESQKIAKDYGALFTPEFFVLDAARKVVYMGGMDDSSVIGNVKEKHLDAAMEALLAGKKPPQAETPAIGCRIRYAKARR
ncbi:MAG TPA: thioredoxin family protein [Planctomycetia bacterium]|nr:thioredoxin family protein [Planctomycetia bacterium]